MLGEAAAQLIRPLRHLWGAPPARDQSARQLYAAAMSAGYETLKNLSSGNAKHSKWCVCVFGLKIVKYNFMARKEAVSAEKLECLFVSKTP